MSEGRAFSANKLIALKIFTLKFSALPVPRSELTFLDHSYSQTLLESAELAAIPPPLVHGTVLVGQANILGILLYRPLANQKKHLSR